MKHKVLLIKKEYPSQLAELIKKSYNNLAQLIATIASGRRNERNINFTGGKVSISDIIAYQIGWASLLINWYKAGIDGNKIPEMPGEGFSKWDYVGLARHFYSTYEFDCNGSQDTEFYTRVCDILSIVEKEYKNGNLDKRNVWRWCRLKSGTKWPLSKWVQINTVSPYQRAHKIIKKHR